MDAITLQKKIEETQQLINNKNNEIQITARLGKELLEENEKLKNKLESLKLQVNDDDDEEENIIISHNKLKEINSKIERLSILNKDLENKIALKNVDIEELSARIIEYEKQIQSLANTIASDKETIMNQRQLYESASDLEDTIEKIRKTTKDYESKIAENKKIIQGLIEKLQDDEEKSDSFNETNDIEELMKNNEHLKEEIKNIDNKISQLQEIADAISASKERKDELLQIIKDLMDENQKLEREVEAKEELVKKERLLTKSLSSRNDLQYRRIQTQNNEENDHVKNTHSEVIIHNTIDDESQALLKYQKEKIEELTQQLQKTESLLNSKQEELIEHLSSLKSTINTPETKKPRTKKEGYLIKRGQIIRSWRRRFFYISSTGLYYAKTKETRHAALGVIDLDEASIELDPAFPLLFKIRTPKRLWFIKAENQEDMDDWIKVLEARIKYIKQKKKQNEYS